MRIIARGNRFLTFAVGDVTCHALFDGHVDVPRSQLRQTGDFPFSDDGFPDAVPLIGGKHP